MSFFSQTTVSTCYAISLQKVYKLSGKFINLIECLTSFPRQGNNTLRSVHGIVEGWGWGGWLEVLGGRGGGVVVGSLSSEVTQHDLSPTEKYAATAHFLRIYAHTPCL